ncbi:MAG: ABC transporter ATP-binding protein/permease [Clostridia bacterium]|nr:ABC transporter ATP-binding protein/permease [Clostridia bacterium]
MNRVFSFEDEKEFPKDKFGTRYIGDIKGKISFKGVSFGYNDEERVLKDISFDVKEKSNVAFVGESGAGKTTVLSLLTKNYSLENHGKGHIYIDDLDIEEFSEKSFRSIISYIPQMPYIFNMSIRDNLLLVKENATEEELDEALKNACLYEYVVSLPDGKDTIIGEGGINLSGGQRQRLAIARSLLKDCRILILDEATSALDNITQNEIKNVINNLANKYTVITIAHRLSTIKEADEIFVLANGKIEAKGKHEELLNNPIYSKLYAGEIE